MCKAKMSNRCMLASLVELDIGSLRRSNMNSTQFFYSQNKEKMREKVSLPDSSDEGKKPCNSLLIATEKYG